MQLVADTNIIVAAILREGDTRKLLFSRRFEVFCPDRVKTEVISHKKEFLKKSGLDEKSFLRALDLLFEYIAVVPVEEYISFSGNAISLCPKGHEDDWPFLALSLALKCGLWSNDSALKKQFKILVFSTTELLKIK